MSDLHVEQTSDHEISHLKKNENFSEVDKKSECI